MKQPPSHLIGKPSASLFILWVFLLLLPLQGQSDTLFAKQSDSLLQQPDFLPVEEAYQLSVSRDEQGVHLNWDIAEGYYLYKHRFAFSHPQSGHNLPLQPQYDRVGKAVYDEFYQRELEVYYHSLSIQLPELVDQSQPLDMIVQSQACADAGLCYPPRSQRVSFDSLSSIATVSEGGTPANQPISAPTASTTSMWLIILSALAGGLILNLMPCVFPVLSIKALSLASHHSSTKNRLLHGVWYSVGVVASFVVIAIALLALRAAGEAVGWGFQLQSPAFITALVYLFVVMGLSFSGVFYMGARLMNVGQSASDGNSLTSSFMTGVLAAVVASPCSAPFMGTALGFALTQPAATSLTLFAVLGFGMALPFLLLSAWPGLSARIPKPGPWMESLKEFLAFPLYLSAVWLLWVLGRQTGSDMVTAVITGIVLIVFAIWITHRNSQNQLLTRTLAALALVAAVIIPYNTYQDDQPADWEAYSPQRLDELTIQGNPVFVNLTADWCITCLTNEAVVLNQDEIRQAFKTAGVYYLKGDWTRYDPKITELLNRYQRSGVPLYLYFSPDSSEPEILPQILTKNALLNAINHKVSEDT